MYNPKTEVYEALKSLGYATSQGYQAIFNEVPAITFSVDSNSVDLDLGNEIASQSVFVRVDIYANDSVTTSRILGEVEAKMRSIFYRLSSATDVPRATEDALYHISCNFSATKCT